MLNLDLHKDELLESVTDLSPLLACLESAEETIFNEEEKKVIFLDYFFVLYRSLRVFLVTNKKSSHGKHIDI